MTSKQVIQATRSTCHIVAMMNKYWNVENREQSFLKYYLDSYLFQVSGDEHSPSVPKEDFIEDELFVGYFRRVIRFAIAKQQFDFIYSLQKGCKKYWPAKTPQTRAKAYRDHAKNFSTDHGRIPLDLTHQIEETSREVFRLAASKPQTKFTPSGSASLQSSVTQGGNLECYERFKFPGTTEESAVGKLRALSQALETWRYDNYNRGVDYALEDLEYGGVFPRNLDIDVIAIDEPSKHRSISKSDSYLASSLRPVQGVMLDCWKSQPDSTMRHADLTERIQEIDLFMSDTICSDWASIDYSSATDLVKIDATFAALEGLRSVRGFGLLSSSFNGGIATYPAVTGPLYEDDGVTPKMELSEETGEMVHAVGVIQKSFQVFVRDAQPMGHVCSFALLCVINRAVLMTAIDRWEAENKDGVPTILKRYAANKMRKSHSRLINGDDMVFKCHPSFYPIFNKTAADAGFKISRGKQYLSPYMAMINSQLFIRPTRKRSGQFEIQYCDGLDIKPIWLPKDGPEKKNSGSPWFDEVIGLISTDLFRGHHYFVTDREGAPLPVKDVDRRNCRYLHLRSTFPKPMIRCGYLNQNIIMGVCLKNQGSDYVTPVSLARDFNVMCQLVPWAKSCLPLMLKRFDEINRGFQGRFYPNWFLPAHLGGYGIDIDLAPLDMKITRDQRFMAACFVNDKSLALYKLEGIKLLTGRYIESLVDFKMYPGCLNHVYSEMESKAREEGDVWMQRIAYISRLAQGSSPMAEDALSLNKRLLYLKKRSEFGRLSPMTREGLIKYWTVNWIADFRIPCPDLHDLSLKISHKMKQFDFSNLNCTFETQQVVLNNYLSEGPDFIKNNKSLIRRVEDSRFRTKMERYKIIPHGQVKDIVENYDALVEIFRGPEDVDRYIATRRVPFSEYEFFRETMKFLEDGMLSQLLAHGPAIPGDGEEN
jgi:hypothetical protein